MKRLIVESYDVSEDHCDVFAMSKLNYDEAKDDIKNWIHGFIYFSGADGGHGPRIKFYGGTSDTKSTRRCPSVKFDVVGNCELVLANWMTRKNCPNAFDPVVLKDLGSFIRAELPVLLLTWFYRIDERNAQHYLEGTRSLEQMLNKEGIYLDSYDIETLNRYCRNNDMYSFIHSY